MSARIVIVTGTSTGVGKTVATAALAAVEPAAARVEVIKPVQTGTDLGDSDAREITRLSGARTTEFTTLPEPLAPDTAARRAGVSIPTVAEHAARIRDIAAACDLVYVEGAGGILVRLDSTGGTLLDLAAALAAAGERVAFVVIAGPGLGTLNHTELTVDAIRARGFAVEGLVVGAWPATPGLAEQCNLEDLPRLTGVPLLGVIPSDVGGLTQAEFSAAAPGWFASDANAH